MRKFVVIVAKLILGLLSLSGVVLLMFVGWLFWHYEYGIGLPDDKKLLATSAVGQICSSGNMRTFVPLAETPLLVRSAVLAYEEPDFYQRPGLSEPVRLLFNHSALRPNILSSVTRCFMSSTPIRGFDWHVGSFIMMTRVDKTLSRDALLEIYLNELYFGRGASGVAAAAAAYFGKSLGDLDIDEVAFIVALPRAPSIGRNKDRATERRNFVIERMLQAEIISDPEAKSAKERPLVLK